MKKLWVCLSGAALVVCVGFASAYFNAQISVPENVIQAGSVSVASVPASSAVSAENIAPGALVSRQFTVRNTGTLPSNVVVTGARRSGITAFYDALLVRVSDGTRVIYEGKLNALRTTPVKIAAGDSANLVFDMTLPADAPDSMMGDHVNLTLHINAEQDIK